MPNQNSPHGFAILATEQSNSFNAQCHMYAIPSTDATNTYSIGDSVKSVTTGSADTSNPWGTFGIQMLTKATGASGDIPRGIIISVFRNPFNLDTLYVPQVKAANYYVLVCDDPNIVFEAIPDGNNAYSGLWIGANAVYTQNAVNAATLSNTVINSTATTGIGSNAAFPLKIIQVAQRPNVSTGLYVPLVCTWNLHELRTGTGTTGST